LLKSSFILYDSEVKKICKGKLFEQATKSNYSQNHSLTNR